MGTQDTEFAHDCALSEGPRESQPPGVDEASKQALLEAARVFDAVPIACCTVDASGTILQANSALVRLLGTSSDGCRGRSFSRFFAGSLRATVEEQLRSLTAGALPSRVQLEGLELTERSGALRLVAVALPAGRGPRRCLVSLFEPAERGHLLGVGSLHELEAMGVLANGVAHDFGNILQGVMGSLNLALRSASSPSRVREHIEQAMSAVRRGALLVQTSSRLERKKEPFQTALSLGAASSRGDGRSSAAAGESAAPAQPETHFAGRALLVEDDWRVRLGIRHYLQQLGFEVIEAGDAVEALSRASGALVLLVTDVILPELTGPKIQERLRESYPDLKALYMSAHPPRYLIDQGLLQASDIILQKPFELKELAFRLAELCSTQAAGASSGN